MGGRNVTKSKRSANTLAKLAGIVATPSVREATIAAATKLDSRSKMLSGAISASRACCAI